MPGEFGDINWKRLDPKTWELSNNPPPNEPGPSPTPPEEPSVIADMYNQQMMNQAQEDASAVHSKANLAHQRVEWRKQMHMFDSTLKNLDKFPPDAAISGFQELIDSGAMYLTDDGDVYSAVRGRGTQQVGRLLDAARQWGDHYRDQVAQDPDTPSPFKQSLEEWQKSVGMTPR